MYRELTMTLADDSQMSFKFLALGTTAYRYKQVFHSDLMADITKMMNKEMDYFSENADFSVTDKLAFIMNCQAEKRDMNALNFDMFIEWLEQFDSYTLIEHINDFISIYLANKHSTSKPKKEGVQ